MVNEPSVFELLRFDCKTDTCYKPTKSIAASSLFPNEQITMPDKTNKIHQYVRQEINLKKGPFLSSHNDLQSIYILRLIALKQSVVKPAIGLNRLQSNLEMVSR